MSLCAVFAQNLHLLGAIDTRRLHIHAARRVAHAHEAREAP